MSWIESNLHEFSLGFTKIHKWVELNQIFMNFGKSKWIVNHEKGRCAHHCMPAWFIHTKRNLNGLNVTGQSPQWYICLISQYSPTRIIILVEAPLCQFTAWKYMVQSFLWSQLVVTNVWLLFCFFCRFDCWLGNGMGIRLGLGGHVCGSINFGWAGTKSAKPEIQSR